MFSWLPSKAALHGALAALVAGFLAFLRIDAKRDVRRDMKQKDYEHAEDIQERVSDSRNDPDKLRKFDDAGWRD